MKRLIVTILTAGFLTSALAQLFSPESLNGALLGTFIGGIAGGNCHHGFSGNGAAIGARVGFLAGAIRSQTHRLCRTRHVFNNLNSNSQYYETIPC